MEKEKCLKFHIGFVIASLILANIVFIPNAIESWGMDVNHGDEASFCIGFISYPLTILSLVVSFISFNYYYFKKQKNTSLAKAFKVFLLLFVISTVQFFFVEIYNSSRSNNKEKEFRQPNAEFKKWNLYR